MSELNYDFFLTARSTGKESESSKPARLRAVEWYNPKGASKRSSSARPSPSTSQVYSTSRRSTASGLSSANRHSSLGSSSKVAEPPPRVPTAPTSGVYQYNISSSHLTSPAAIVACGPTNAAAEQAGVSLSDYYELLMSAYSFNDASPMARDKAPLTSPAARLTGGSLPREASREVDATANVPPWLAHHSTMTVLSDGDDGDDEESDYPVLNAGLFTPASRESIRSHLDTLLSFLTDCTEELTVGQSPGSGGDISSVVHDKGAAREKEADAVPIRPNTFTPMSHEPTVSAAGATAPQTTRAGAAPATTDSQFPGLPSRRRRSEQLVSFKPQMVQVVSVDPSPRTVAYSTVVFRNPTIREQGREMQKPPADVRRHLVRDRQNAVYTVAILDEDAVGPPLLVACGSHVRVYPTLSSREESTPPPSYPNGTTSKRRASIRGRRASQPAQRTGAGRSTATPTTGFDDFEQSFVVDEAVSRPSGSSQYASVALDELQEAWLNGRNACLVLGASKARTVGTVVLAKQFLATAAADLSASLKEDAGEGSWFEMQLTMGEALDTEDGRGERGCEVRDLLAPAVESGTAEASAPPADVYISTSAFFGPAVVGFSEEILTDGTSTRLQNAITQGFIQHTRDVERWSSKHAGKPHLTPPVCFAQIHLKTVRNGDREPSVSSKKAARDDTADKREVFLSSLLILFVGTAPATLHGLSGAGKLPRQATRLRRDWQSSEAFITALLRSALGGHTRTVVCTCLSDCDADVAVDWLECLASVRDVQNESPLTGNVSAFVRCLQLVVERRAEDTARASTHRSSSALDTQRICAKINQLSRFLKDPTLPIPKLSLQALTLMVN